VHAARAEQDKYYWYLFWRALLHTITV